MAKIYESVTELIGGTPILNAKNFAKQAGANATLLAKLEYFNPAGSVKDRIAKAMIDEAEKSGKLKEGSVIIEPTSGNTGIGLAAIAATKGYKFRVYIQDQVSAERFQVIKAFGAEVIKLSEEPVIVETMEKTGGDFIAAVAALRDQVLAKEEGIFFVDQLSNPANPAVHESTTGPEIWEDTNGNVDILVASVGTGGTVSGTGKYLKSKNPDLYVVALQPGKNSLPSPENPAPEEIMGVHPFAGVPREMVPEIMDMDIYDERYDVETPDAYRVTREVAKTDGILVGTSSGAAIFAATEIAKRPENAGKNIVVILPDTGLRYLSTNLFNEDFEV